MQALLENEIVSLYTQNSTLSEFDELMERAKAADAMLKNKIETDIVKSGLKFVPELINPGAAPLGISHNPAPPVQAPAPKLSACIIFPIPL